MENPLRQLAVRQGLQSQEASHEYPGEVAEGWAVLGSVICAAGGWMSWPAVAGLVCVAGDQTRCVVHWVRVSFDAVVWMTYSHSVPAHTQIAAVLSKWGHHS